MFRFLFILGIVIAAAMIYAVVDVVLTDRFRVRGAPKGVWVAIVLLLPAVGVVLWFTLGRAPRRSVPLVVRAPDDDPSFLERLNRETDDRIRKLEQELADLDDDPPATKE